MRRILLLVAGLSALLASRLPARAQTLDPGFAAPTLYAPGTLYSALEQPDGKRVVTGIYTRVNGTGASAISRFNTNGTLDAAFQLNVGAASAAYKVRLLGNGQFMLAYSTVAPFTAGGITRQTMLRLNADGTGDASFDIGAGPSYDGEVSYVDDFTPLPNGQFIAAGGFNQFNGTPVPEGVVRLSATGALDPTFNAGGSGTGPYDDVMSVVALPNGQLLIGGYIYSYNGVTRNGLARLNADGTLDPTFAPPLLANSYASNIVVQPDGKILLSGGLFFSSTGNGQGIARLNADGSQDFTFTPPVALAANSVYSYVGNALQLQPDGKILFINDPRYNGTNLPGVNRLNANGTLDPSFQVGAGPDLVPSSLTLLASGEVLVAGSFTNFSGTLDRTLVQLTSTGAVTSNFQPLIQRTGSVVTLVRQPDGKLVAGGNFSEINGQAVRRLARFNPNGTLDATFAPNVGLDLPVVDVALQPDGRLLAATAASVTRHLTTGGPDNSWNAPSFLAANAARILLQPDGRVLVGGINVAQAGNVVNSLVRLLPDGSRDASFAPATTGARVTSFQTMALQPDGKVLVAGGVMLPGGTNSVRGVLRLESTGTTDTGFTSGTFTGTVSSARFLNLTVQPDGKVLAAGTFSAVGGVARTNVARLNPTGTLDTSFAPPALTGSVSTVVLQPNNRVLVGGLFTSASLPANLARLLPDGQPDASFAATAVPNSNVRTVLVQPDGALVVGGNFTALSGQTSLGLARLTAPNVLHVAAPRALAERTTAWPVPAHTTLYVAPDPAAHAQALELLDLLGRPVLYQTLTGHTTPALSLGSLRPGQYVLRVTYAEGTVTRHIQVK